MTAEFKKRQLNFLLFITILSVILFGVHSYLLFHFGSKLNLFFPVWQIYVFNIVVTTLFYTIINYRFSEGQKNVLILFMASTLIKMFLAILFLLPLLLSDLDKKQWDVFNFFIPYFFYLAFEVLSITKFLQNQS